MSTRATAAKPAAHTPDLEAWLQRSLAQPGGHGPIPKSAESVLAAVFGQPQPKAKSA